MEEGEIPSDGKSTQAGSLQMTHATVRVPLANVADTPGAVYSPAYEWPGEDAPYPHSNLSYPTSDPTSSEQESLSLTPARGGNDNLSQSSRHANALPSLRFIVQDSIILSKKQKIAVIDGYTEVQFGRDAPPPGSDVPKIRLKEMEVSKLHATVYWDTQRHEWAVVDMGSKHGTFLKTNPGPEPSSSTGVRLSPERTASIPRQMRHGDHLTMGGTTFLVHIHEDSLPCTSCTSQGNDEIPLFHTRATASNGVKRNLEAADASQAYEASPRDPKKALTMLKKSLLSRHGHVSVSSSGPQYVDRSAKRRAMHPELPPEPPASSHHVYTAIAPTPSAPSPPVSAPPAPLPPSNIGHRLLMKQGWQPGSTLGQSDSEGITLLEPLDVSMHKNRVGLGMSSLEQPASSSTLPTTARWKDTAKFKRWDDVRANDDRSARQ